MVLFVCWLESGVKDLRALSVSGHWVISARIKRTHADLNTFNMRAISPEGRIMVHSRRYNLTSFNFLNREFSEIGWGASDG